MRFEAFRPFVLGRRKGGSEASPGPVNTVAPAITGTAEVGETLTCSTGTWTGTGTITYARQWQRDGVDIAGATGSTYTLVSADGGASVRCIVTATDDEGSRSAVSNAVSIPGLSGIGVMAIGSTFEVAA